MNYCSSYIWYITSLCVLITYVQVSASTPEKRSTVLETIQAALNLGNASAEYNREECVWRPTNDAAVCPDPDVNFYLYTGDNTTHGVRLEMNEKEDLRSTDWDPEKSNIVLIHGYAGGDGKFPTVLLRDAYINNGSYNVFVVDWGGLAKNPCYPAAVHNIRTVAHCTAQLFSYIRNMGVESKDITCVGHSLGAHTCGLISNHLSFRMHRIIGLDPAKPLIRSAIRLKPGSAEVVQVMHTNAGGYGDSGKLGKVDFCLNGGKVQPLCENNTKADLCSHVVSLCYLAESIDSSKALKALPCSRRCPNGPRPTHRIGVPVLFGEHTPPEASGSYCVVTKGAPYCARSKNDVGHPWCCLDEQIQLQELLAPLPMEPQLD